MRRAMAEAELGDEQRFLDPTVNRVEARVAILLGKERAVLLPSATMANQIALTLHCALGGEVLCHQSAHVYNYEAGGLAFNARAQVVALGGDGGFFDGHAVRAATRSLELHLPRSRAVVVENTTNAPGGRVWPDEMFDSVVAAARDLDLRLHLDGARLWNAAVAHGVDVSRWSSVVDTVSVCFSKGLGCPFGAILAGDEATMYEARRLKQAMGGALRQAGIVAACMEYALDHHVQRLTQDHERARRLASSLAGCETLSVAAPETNMVFLDPLHTPAGSFVRALEAEGVLASVVQGRVRLCTHLGIDDDAVQSAASVILRVASRDS
jgi:threonine aldolase